MSTKQTDILSWLYRQISRDEKLYPHTSRHWEHEHSPDVKVIHGKRKWRGKKAWWRCGFRSSKSALFPWTREKSDTPGLFTLDEVFFPSKWKIYPRVAFYAVMAAWRAHWDTPDSRVEDALVSWSEHAEYIAEWDPERTDRECAAKRSILQRHRRVPDMYKMGGYFCSSDLDNWPCQDIRDMAAIYSHRKGYGQWAC